VILSKRQKTWVDSILEIMREKQTRHRMKQTLSAGERGICQFGGDPGRSGQATEGKCVTQAKGTKGRGIIEGKGCTEKPGASC